MAGILSDFPVLVNPFGTSAPAPPHKSIASEAAFDYLDKAYLPSNGEQGFPFSGWRPTFYLDF